MTKKKEESKPASKPTKKPVKGAGKKQAPVAEPTHAEKVKKFKAEKVKAEKAKVVKPTAEAVALIQAQAKRWLVELPVSVITQASPYQTRRKFDPEKLNELAESIKVHGVMQPVLVREVKPGEFQLIAGERRVRASRTIDTEMVIPMTVIDATDQQAAEMCVTENFQRQNLCPLEEADGVKALLDVGLTRCDVANRLGYTRQWVARREQLCKLCSDVKARIDDDSDVMSKVQIEALEVIAQMLPDDQVKLANMFKGDFTPTINGVKHAASQLMRQLKNPPFDASECRACMKRTGCLTDLFEHEDPESELGRCLDAPCYELKTMNARIAKIEAAKAKEPKAVIFSDSYQVYQNTPGVEAGFNKCECGKNVKGALPAFKMDEKGELRKTYVSPNGSSGGRGDTAKPSVDMRRKAWVARRVRLLLEDSRGENASPYFFEKIGIELVAFYVASFGTITNDPFIHADSDPWADIQKWHLSDHLKKMWLDVCPVLEKRIKYLTVGECEPYYVEACKIAGHVFGLTQVDLDIQAAESIKDKAGDAEEAEDTEEPE